MTEKFLIPLDVENKWMLTADATQWLISRANVIKGEIILNHRSFVNSDQNILQRCFREHGVNLTDEAKAKLAELPHTFAEFAEIYKPKSGKGRKGTDGPKVPVVSSALAKWNGYQVAMKQEAKNCPHRTGTALAREWFIGYDSYFEGKGEPHKPTPRNKDKPKDTQDAALVNVFDDWNKPPSIPDHMLIKPKNRRG